MAFGRSPVDNQGVINLGVDLWVKRAEALFVAEYRRVVWDTFNRILNQTPQYSGAAAASWNIGIGAPDYSFVEYNGKVKTQALPNSAFSENILVPRQRGDRAAIQAAQRRNKPKLDLITRRTRVYFNNAVRGDNDRGRATELYLEALQDPAYWKEKLRAVNQPYETAQESIMFVIALEKRQRGQGVISRIGGENYQ